MTTSRTVVPAAKWAAVAACLAVLAWASAPAFAQEAASAPAASEPASAPAASAPANAIASRPAASRPAASNAPMSLNFKDASLRSVLEYFSEAAGLIIVGGGNVEGRVTIISRQDVSVDEAVSLLDTVLKEKGYAAIRNERVLKIVTLDEAKKELIPIQQGNDPTKIPPGDRVITQVVPIRYADAVKLKADLASLIPSSTDVASNASSNTLIVTGTQSSIRKLVEIIQAIDVHMSEVSQVKVFQLKYANAANAARLITDIFREDQTAAGGVSGGGAGGGGGGGNRARRAFMQAMAAGGPPGAAAASAGGAADSSGVRTVRVTASSDDRTNSLVVSASPEVMKVIEGVVKDLDANPAETQAVFIYRVRNGNAQNMQSVLNTTFGWTGSGTGGTTGGTRTTGGTAQSAFGGGAFASSGSFGSRTGGSGGSAAGRTGGTGGNAGNRGGTGGGFAGAVGGAGARAGGTTGAGMASDLVGQVYVVADADTNSLLVTTSSKNFERVKAILMDLDRPVPQVLIKVLIAEVTHDDSLDLGVEFQGMNLRVGGKGFQTGSDFNIKNILALPGTESGFMFQLNEQYVQAAIRALAGVSKLDVLSRPYILTSDNQAANILVGQEVPIPTDTRVTDTGQTISSVTYQSIGISVTVTPHINPQGIVTMDISPEVSSLTDSTVEISPGVFAPVFNRRLANSRVAIRDGQTIVIGGLMEDRLTKTVSKTPFLGDIPIVGLLFQRSTDVKTKTELLFFMTPHVAEEPDELKSMSEDEESGMKIVPKAVEPGAFEQQMRGMERGASTRPAGQFDTSNTQTLHMLEQGASSTPGSGANAPAPAAGGGDE